MASAVAACACGQTYADDIPPALIDAIKNPNVPARPDSGALSYPDPPYGGQVGDTIQNLCFVGWKNPKADGFDPDKAVPICIDEFYDPSGTRNKLLLIESAAVWCAPCRTEYGGSGNRPSLATHLARRQSQGFRLLGTLFQDASAEPADMMDASLWARTFDVSFPFAVDEDHQQLGLFSPPCSSSRETNPRRFLARWTTSLRRTQGREIRSEPPCRRCGHCLSRSRWS
jgi:hypothetical protein